MGGLQLDWSQNSEIRRYKRDTKGCVFMFSKILLGLLIGVCAGVASKIASTEESSSEKSMSVEDLATVRRFAVMASIAAIGFVVYTFIKYPAIYGIYAIVEVFVGALLVGFVSPKNRQMLYEVAVSHLFFLLPILVVVYYVFDS